MWKVKHFTELTTNELYQILALRNQVFVVAQKRLYQDQAALHIFKEDQEGKELVVGS